MSRKLNALEVSEIQRRRADFNREACAMIEQILGILVGDYRQLRNYEIEFVSSNGYRFSGDVTNVEPRIGDGNVPHYLRLWSNDHCFEWAYTTGDKFRGCLHSSRIHQMREPGTVYLELKRK